MDSIFGTGQSQSRLPGINQESVPKDLVVKAGVMTIEDKKVKPDMRKGKIRISESDMEAMKFQWIDVANNDEVVEELYLFPDDAEFKKVGQGQSRIYVLNMKSWETQKYFWLQEPDKDKDEEVCKKINEAINRQPSPLGGAGGNDLAAQMMAGNGGADAGLPAMGGQGGNQQEMLSQLLAGMQNFQQRKESQTPGLASCINSEAIEKMINDPTYFAELSEHLPEGYQTEEGFRESLRSPQFRQALDALTGAVNSEQMMAVITSLDLDSSVINDATDGVDALVRALEKKSEVQRKEQEDKKTADEAAASSDKKEES